MRVVLLTGITIFLCGLCFKVKAQTDQIVVNGAQTTPVNFPSGACTYQWTNSNPSIGLPANGVGDIPAFIAANNGNGPVTATITATPVQANIVYVPDLRSESVYMFNSITGASLGRIALGGDLTGLVISPNGATLYAVNGDLSVIDIANSSLTNSIPAPSSLGYFNFISIGPGGNYLYVPDWALNTVSVISTATNAIVGTVTLGSSPLGVAGNSDGSEVFLANAPLNTVSIVNTATNTVISSILVGTNPNTLCVSPDGNKLYVANTGSNTISVISTATKNVIATIPVGTAPIGLFVSYDNKNVYVTNSLSNSVSVIDAATDQVISTIPTGSVPRGVCVSADNQILYVENTGENTISVIDILSQSTIKIIDMGGNTIPETFGNFISSNFRCVGTPITFKIIVNSGPTPVVTTSTVTGNISGCIGSPSQSPNIGQFTVAGTSLTGDITLTPPPGFDISLTAIGGYSPNLVLKQIGGAVISTTIYVRSSAADPAGPISGNIQITTPGATADQVAVTGTVNALPAVNPVQNQIVNGSALTTAVNFSGTADSFDWTNDTPSIGLPASGTGNIPSFTALNTTGATLKATITVTPKATTTGCPGTPITFTITVNSILPSVTAGTPTGTITACAGTASASPNVEQFTVSGSNLTGNITATAPANFEVSLTPGNGYSNSIMIPQSAGAVNNVTVYVRSAATATGSVPGAAISGDVVLSSTGAADQKITVTGTIYAAPVANPVPNQTRNAGQASLPIVFTGTGTPNLYTWTNDTPGIGLAASGTGDIPSFTLTDPNGNTPATATITVTPQPTPAGACTPQPVTFTITVNPAPPSVIKASAIITGLSTTYGTASPSERFTVSLTSATSGVLVTPPPGFEVSTDNQNFSSTVTAGQAGGDIVAVPVYIRIAATTPVGNYSGNITLSADNANSINAIMPFSIVDKATLTVTGPYVSRAYGTPNPPFIPGYTGFAKGDSPSSLTTLPVLTTTATINSPPGQYVIQVTGGSSPNYQIVPVNGTLTIVASVDVTKIPNVFTPNGDGINDFWNIKELVNFPQCLVSVYSRYGSLVFQSRGYAKPWDGMSNGSPVPAGTYYYIINPNLDGLPPLSGFVAVLR